jgi:catechol 2,3-dioxygenase-like lactoylglutathione lyase family enzyme
MKWLTGFLAGTFVGALLMQTVLAQNDPVPPRPERAVNHVGIVVDDYDAAYSFYTEMLGLKEAYTIERNGQTFLTYLQLNRETFIELIPARGDEPRGVTHIGVEVRDIDALVAHLRERGLDVADPGLTPGNARMVRVRDASGIELEVMEYGPESQQYRAMAAWQP